MSAPAVTPEQIAEQLAALVEQMQRCFGDDAPEPRRADYLGVRWALVRMVDEVPAVDLRMHNMLTDQICGASRRLGNMYWHRPATAF